MAMRWAQICMILHLVSGLLCSNGSQLKICKNGSSSSSGGIGCGRNNITITAIEAGYVDSCDGGSSACPLQTLGPRNLYYRFLARQCDSKTYCNMTIDWVDSDIADRFPPCGMAGNSPFLVRIAHECVTDSSSGTGSRTVVSSVKASSSVGNGARPTERRAIFTSPDYMTTFVRRTTTISPSINETQPTNGQQHVNDSSTDVFTTTALPKDDTTRDDQPVVLGVSIGGGILFLMLIVIVAMVFGFKKTLCQKRTPDVKRSNEEGEENSGYQAIENTDSGGYLEIDDYMKIDDRSIYPAARINNEHQRAGTVTRQGSLSSAAYQGPDIVYSDQPVNGSQPTYENW